jgi:hypothetical protein
MVKDGRRAEMFEMQHRCADGVVRTLGMAHDARDHPRIFVTKNGSHLTAKDWKKMRRLALDDLPESIHVPRTPSASDEVEHRIGMLRHVLRGYGLDDDSIDEACEICRRELAGEVTDDELPIAGACHALFAGESREPGERSFRASGRSESRSRPPLGTKASHERSGSVLSEQEYRSSPASNSASFEFPKENLTPHYEPPESERRSSARARRLAADAASDAAGESLLRLFGPDGPACVGVGEWPKRR